MWKIFKRSNVGFGSHTRFHAKKAWMANNLDLLSCETRHVAIPRLLGIGIEGFDEYWCIGSIGIDGTEVLLALALIVLKYCWHWYWWYWSVGGIGIDSFGIIRYWEVLVLEALVLEVLVLVLEHW
jgi:hypothetical protein